MARQLPADWEPCPPGEIAKLAKRLDGRHRRRVVLRAAAAAALTAAGGALVFWLGGDLFHDPGPVAPGDFTYGGVSCTKVKAEADAYGRGEVAASLRRRIDEHLARCGLCRSAYQARGVNV